MIGIHIKIRTNHIKNEQSSGTDIDSQNEVFDEFNTIALTYFGQISISILFMVKKT